MAGRSTQWIWTVMMTVSLTSTVVFSQSLGTCLDRLNGNLSSLPGLVCNESNTQQQLAGAPQAFFTCPSNGGSDIVIQQWDMYPSTDGNVQSNIQMNTEKYGTSTDRLQINNLQPGDEGAYVCTLMVDSGPSMDALGGCLAIYGKAEFVTRGNMLDITVNRGDDIVFDTALKFQDRGSCGLNQTISILQLQKIDSNDVVDCETSLRCRLSANFTYTFGEHGNITKFNAIPEDEGQYRLGVSVVNPPSEVLQRTFNVFVIEGNTATPDSVAGPTPSPAPTSAISTVIPSNTGVVGGTGGDIPVAAIVVPIVLLLIVAVVMIIMVALYIWYKRRPKMSEDNIKKQEPLYDNIHPSNGSGNVIVSDDYGYHAPLSLIDENSRHSVNLDDVYLADRLTDQVGSI